MNIAASILQNPELLEKSYEAAQHSEGVGQKELDIYLDSISARIQKLQNHLQELAAVNVDTDWLKDIISLFDKAIQAITVFTDKVGGLNTVVGIAVGTLLGTTGNGKGTPTLMPPFSQQI